MAKGSNALTKTEDTGAVAGTSAVAIERANGGEGTHLSDAARALVIERIIAGDKNQQINLALVKAGHLPKGASLSTRTYSHYRRLNECRVDARRLTVEAMQVGHVAVSEAILYHRDMMHETMAVLMPGGKFASVVGDRQKLAAALFDKSTKFLMNSLWATGLPETLKDEARLAEMAEKLKAADTLPEVERLNLMLEMRDSLNAALRALINRMRAGSTTVAPAPAPAPPPASEPLAALEGTTTS